MTIKRAVHVFVHISPNNCKQTDSRPIAVSIVTIILASCNLTGLRRSSSDQSIDAGRSTSSGTRGSYRLISAARFLAAVNELHVAAAYWLSIDGTDGRTDGHPAVTQTLTAYYHYYAASVKKYQLSQTNRATLCVTFNVL